MATSFPGALDSLPRPLPGAPMNVAPYTGAGVIDNISDAIEAIEAKLGTGAAVAAANQVLRGTGAGASAFGQIQTADIAAAAVSRIVGSIVNAPSLVNTTTPTAIGGASGQVTWTPTAGHSLTLLFINYFGITCTVAYPSATFVVYLDGAGTSSYGFVGTIPSTGNNVHGSTIVSLGTPSAAAHTVDVRWTCPSGASTISMTQLSLLVVELKK